METSEYFVIRLPSHIFLQTSSDVLLLWAVECYEIDHTSVFLSLLLLWTASWIWSGFITHNATSKDWSQICISNASCGYWSPETVYCKDLGNSPFSYYTDFLQPWKCPHIQYELTLTSETLLVATYSEVRLLDMHPLPINNGTIFQCCLFGDRAILICIASNNNFRTCTSSDIHTGQYYVIHNQQYHNIHTTITCKKAVAAVTAAAIVVRKCCSSYV